MSREDQADIIYRLFTEQIRRYNESDSLPAHPSDLLILEDYTRLTLLIVQTFVPGPYNFTLDF